MADLPHEAICTMKISKSEPLPIGTGGVACRICAENGRGVHGQYDVLFVERNEHQFYCETHLPPHCAVDSCERMALNAEYHCDDHEACLEHVRYVCYKHSTPSRIARA